MPSGFQLSPALGSLPTANTYLVGVSGGRDSVALLHALVERGYRNLVVCHLNHQLRGRSSSGDASFCRALAKKNGLHVETASVNVRALAKKKKLSLETAAREARYEFFATVAKRTRCHTLFLAHHADDLVETFLINLFRGAGAAGLAAIRETSTRKVGDVRLTIVRPLLGVWRREVDAYVASNRIKFREDASNAELTPLRNRLRHRIIPYLEKTLDRNIRQNVWRTATITAEEENFLQTLLPESVAGAVELATEPLRKLNLAVQRRAVQQWLRDSGVVGVGFELVERVRSLLDVTSDVAKVNLPRDRHVHRRAKKLFIED